MKFVTAKIKYLKCENAIEAVNRFAAKKKFIGSWLSCSKEKDKI